MRAAPEVSCAVYPKKGAHEHTGAAENIRHSLRNGFTAYNALSPVSHVLLPPSTPTMGRQDHTSIFWHSVKHAETKKTLQYKRFSTTLMRGVSAGFTKS